MLFILTLIVQFTVDSILHELVVVVVAAAVVVVVVVIDVPSFEKENKLGC